MHIRCDCGEFKAELMRFPRDTPGRLACYCNDCQTFLRRIDRPDVLDNYGGTEVIPVYPSDVRIASGRDQLQCHQLSPRGLHRWTARCCNTPIGNTRPGLPWFGALACVYRNENDDVLDNLGRVRSRVWGLHATNDPPFKVSPKLGFVDLVIVAPFLLKGKLLRKHRKSPFYLKDGKTPICSPKAL